MDHIQNIAPAPDLQPPKESRTSIVLNSVGNGMMLGGIPFIGLEAVHLFKESGKPLPLWARAASITMAAIGGVLGWVFGEKEANRLENYRNNIAQELTTIRNDVQELKQDRRHWQNRITAETKDTHTEEKETNQVSL